MPTPEGVWAKEIEFTWEHYNALYLSGRLRRPGIHISGADSYLGAWDGAARIIRISRIHIERDPWLGVLDTLRHEMAHQFVDEILATAKPQTPHGDAFRYACKQLRVSPLASGRGCEMTETGPVNDDSVDPVRRKVAKLLALGSSPNEHEARLAVEKARELLWRHQMQPVDAAGTQQSPYEVRSVGAVKGRRARYEYALSAVLQDFFFVDAVWGFSFDAKRLKRGSILMLHGRPAQLDMAIHVHAYLTDSLPRLWRDYCVEHGVTSNRGRLDYYWGILEGLRQKLESQSGVLEASTGLVWQGDAGLSDFVADLHPGSRSVSRGAKVVGASFDGGVAAGRSLTIRTPVGSGETARRGRLLGGGD